MSELGPVGGAGELTFLLAKLRGIGEALRTTNIFRGKEIMQLAGDIERAAKAPQGVAAHVGWMAGHCSDPQNCAACLRVWIREALDSDCDWEEREGKIRAALAAPPAPKLPVPGPVSDDTIHHGMFPPAASVVAARCTNCDQPIYDNGTVYVHRKVLNASTVLETQWCHEVDKGFIAETKSSREAAAPKPAPGYSDAICSRCNEPRRNHIGKPAMSENCSGFEAAPAPLDHSRCSLCGAPRIALDRAETRFGACTFVDCKDPLHDFRVENPNAAIVNDSRSQQKRVAAMKGEPMPTFGTAERKHLYEAGTTCWCGEVNVGPIREHQPTPAPGAERLLEAGDEVWVRGKVTDSRPLPSGAIVVAMSDSSGDDDGVVFVRPEDVREALAAAPSAPTNNSFDLGAAVKNLHDLQKVGAAMGLHTPPTDVESLAATFHDIYQQEAKRQGDVRHKDAYADLPDNVKEFDRVLARYVLANFGDHASAERVRELIAKIQKWRDEGWMKETTSETIIRKRAYDRVLGAVLALLPPSTGEKS